MRDGSQRRGGGQQRVSVRNTPAPALLTVGGAEGSPRRDVSRRGRETSGRGQGPGRGPSTRGGIPTHEVPSL